MWYRIGNPTASEAPKGAKSKTEAFRGFRTFISGDSTLEKFRQVDGTFATEPKDSSLERPSFTLQITVRFIKSASSF
jgi:hypothetical protein